MDSIFGLGIYWLGILGMYLIGSFYWEWIEVKVECISCVYGKVDFRLWLGFTDNWYFNLVSFDYMCVFVLWKE